MKDLNDLLNNTFGSSKSTTKEETKQETKKTTVKRGIYFGRDECLELKIALNYAINSIKRKKEVVQQKEDSTYFLYFTVWNKLREKLNEKLKN